MEPRHFQLRNGNWTIAIGWRCLVWSRRRQCWYGLKTNILTGSGKYVIFAIGRTGSRVFSSTWTTPSSPSVLTQWSVRHHPVGGVVKQCWPRRHSVDQLINTVITKRSSDYDSWNIHVAWCSYTWSYVHKNFIAIVGKSHALLSVRLSLLFSIHNLLAG